LTKKKKINEGTISTTLDLHKLMSKNASARKSLVGKSLFVVMATTPPPPAVSPV